MFNKINSWGNHETYNYVISKHPFIKFFKDLFNTENLEELHLKSKDYNEVKDYLDLGHLNDRDTDLHKIFYNDILTEL